MTTVTTQARTVTVTHTARSVAVSSAARVVAASQETRTVTAIREPRAVTVQLPQTVGAGSGGSPENTITLTAAETLSGHRAIAVVGGQAVHADKDTPDHTGRVVGISLNAATLGDTVTVQTEDSLSHGGWSWTGRYVFVNSAGQLTDTRPVTGFSQRIARVLNATTILIDIDDPVILS